MFSLPLSIDLSPMLSIPPQLQFLLMVNLIVPSQTNVTSIMKCLKLFSTQMISIEEVIEWIGHFDATLKSFSGPWFLTASPRRFHRQSSRAPRVSRSNRRVSNSGH
jgi:hypothetical protein